MTDEQITHILDQIDANKEDLPFALITYGVRVYIIALDYVSIELMHALQLLKITSFDGMMENAISYLDIKSIKSIALSREEP